MLSWGTSLVAQLVKNPPTMQETPVLYWVGKIHRRKNRLPTSVFLGFPGGSAGKEYTCKAGDLGLIPGLGRSLEEGNSYPFQYSCLENSMGRGAWRAAAAKSLQSCPTLCDPRDNSPPGSPVPGILQARTLEWVAISFSIAAILVLYRMLFTAPKTLCVPPIPVPALHPNPW